MNRGSLLRGRGTTVLGQNTRYTEQNIMYTRRLNQHAMTALFEYSDYLVYDSHAEIQAYSTT